MSEVQSPPGYLLNEIIEFVYHLVILLDILIKQINKNEIITYLCSYNKYFITFTHIYGTNLFTWNVLLLFNHRRS